MKLTLDIPDDLYWKLNDKAVRQGRSLDDVVVELLRSQVESEEISTSASPDAQARLSSIERWLALGEEASKNAPPGPTATEILEQDRNRLEVPGYGWPLDEDGNPIIPL